MNKIEAVSNLTDKAH